MKTLILCLAIVSLFSCEGFRPSKKLIERSPTKFVECVNSNGKLTILINTELRVRNSSSKRIECFNSDEIQNYELDKDIDYEFYELENGKLTIILDRTWKIGGVEYKPK